MKSKRKPKNAPLKSIWVTKSRLGNLFLDESEPAPDRLVEAAWCREYRPAGLAEMSNPKERIAELEAERDALLHHVREDVEHDKEIRAAAFEECARALTGQGGGLFSGRALADRIRALATTPPTMVIVERKVLESVLLRAGALLPEGGRDEENVRDIITSIAKALGTK